MSEYRYPFVVVTEDNSINGEGISIEYFKTLEDAKQFSRCNADYVVLICQVLFDVDEETEEAFEEFTRGDGWNGS